MNAKWAEQFGAGKDAVDSGHKVLVGLVNDVKRMIETKDIPALTDAFDKIEIWLNAHFENEKKKLQAANIDCFNRKLEQQFELNSLFFLKGQLVAKNGAWSDGETNLYIQFLSDWLIERITNEDMLLQEIKLLTEAAKTCYLEARHDGKMQRRFPE